MIPATTAGWRSSDRYGGTHTVGVSRRSTRSKVRLTAWYKRFRAAIAPDAASNVRGRSIICSIRGFTAPGTPDARSRRAGMSDSRATVTSYIGPGSSSARPTSSMIAPADRSASTATSNDATTAGSAHEYAPSEVAQPILSRCKVGSDVAWNDATGRGTECRSRGSGPAMTSRSSAASSTVRAIGPMCSSVSQPLNPGNRGSRQPG